MSKEISRVRKEEVFFPMGGIYETTETFEQAQRIAKSFTSSTFVPAEYQGDKNIGNVLIAIDIASRLKVQPLMVMQNLYVVYGKPSWSSSFIAGAINNSRRYAKPLQYELTGSASKGDLACICWTNDLDGNRIEGPKITYEMAQVEGWIDKNGSKWKTMPEVMIRYRAASFFGRLHCSDILMGYYTDDEVIEMPEKERVDFVGSEIQAVASEEANSEEVFIEIDEVSETKENRDTSKENKKESTDKEEVEQTILDGPGY